MGISQASFLLHLNMFSLSTTFEVRGLRAYACERLRATWINIGGLDTCLDIVRELYGTVDIEGDLLNTKQMVINKLHCGIKTITRNARLRQQFHDLRHESRSFDDDMTNAFMEASAENDARSGPSSPSGSSTAVSAGSAAFGRRRTRNRSRNSVDSWEAEHTRDVRERSPGNESRNVFSEDWGSGSD